jgi:hypothetical protein
MNMPGFTAEISLYRTKKNYRISRNDSTLISGSGVVPQYDCSSGVYCNCLGDYDCNSMFSMPFCVGGQCYTDSCGNVACWCYYRPRTNIMKINVMAL